MPIAAIGEKQAKVGTEFMFDDSFEDCKSCNLRQICTGNLEPGRIYKIVRVKKKKHPCSLYEGGIVVVEVEEAKIKAIIDAKTAFEGATITLRLSGCNQVSCKYHTECIPNGLFDNDRIKITKVYKKRIDCLQDRRLKLVQLERSSFLKAST
ncbi:MAG: UPF0179 family protein [Promethearchaeota archaeon]